MKLIIFLLLITSCAQVTSLNLKKHQFGQLPTKIVWIQIAGLSEEHLSILKFQASTSEYKTNMENSLCMGKAWEYDLYRLRPTPKEGFLSQLTGKKNIKNSCEDYEQQPVWGYLKTAGYKAGVFEIDAYKNSLSDSLECNKEFLQDTVLWKMEKFTSQEKMFHQTEKNHFEAGNIYYDKSCQKGDCFTSIEANVFATFEEFSRNATNFVYIVRDFSYFNALSSKNIKQASKKLLELDKIVGYFQALTEKNKDLLVLITTTTPVGLEFPWQGQEWIAYEKTGTNLFYKKTQLMSPVFASGARGENFCGVFEQSQVLERVLSGPDQLGLELKIINPFQ